MYYVVIPDNGRVSLSSLWPITYTIPALHGHEECGSQDVSGWHATLVQVKTSCICIWNLELILQSLLLVPRGECEKWTSNVDCKQPMATLLTLVKPCMLAMRETARSADGID